MSSRHYVLITSTKSPSLCLSYFLTATITSFIWLFSLCPLVASAVKCQIMPNTLQRKWTFNTRAHTQTLSVTKTSLVSTPTQTKYCFLSSEPIWEHGSQLHHPFFQPAPRLCLLATMTSCAIDCGMTGIARQQKKSQSWLARQMRRPLAALNVYDYRASLMLQPHTEQN